MNCSAVAAQTRTFRAGFDHQRHTQQGRPRGSDIIWEDVVCVDDEVMWGAGALSPSLSPAASRSKLHAALRRCLDSVPEATLTAHMLATSPKAPSPPLPPRPSPPPAAANTNMPSGWSMNVPNVAKVPMGNVHKDEPAAVPSTSATVASSLKGTEVFLATAYDRDLRS